MCLLLMTTLVLSMLNRKVFGSQLWLIRLDQIRLDMELLQILQMGNLWLISAMLVLIDVPITSQLYADFSADSFVSWNQRNAKEREMWIFQPVDC